MLYHYVTLWYYTRHFSLSLLRALNQKAATEYKQQNSGSNSNNNPLLPLPPRPQPAYQLRPASPSPLPLPLTPPQFTHRFTALESSQHLQQHGLLATPIPTLNPHSFPASSGGTATCSTLPFHPDS